MKDNNENAQLAATAEVVSSYLLNHKVSVKEMENIIDSVYHAFARLENKNESAKRSGNTGVRIEDSMTDDYLICLEDGKKLKMLKRYLRNNYNISPEEYRKRWGLPADYPMVAPNYAKKRSQLAKDIGLGKQNAKIKSPAQRYKASMKSNVKNKSANKDNNIVTSADSMRAHAV